LVVRIYLYSESQDIINIRYTLIPYINKKTNVLLQIKN
jgi:hypothetical protein